LRLYQQNQEAINELIQISYSENEVATCLNALYGFMMLKLKSSEISPETHKTIERLAHQIGHLSARYIQFEHDDFEF